MSLKSDGNPTSEGRSALTGEAAELAASFVEESRSLLEEANEALLALETNPDDREAINALFRSVHSIKGAAGLFDLPALIHLVHAGEDLLGAMRDGRLRMDAATADELLAGLDYVGKWIGMFQAGGALPDGKMDIARRFAQAYRARLDAGVEAQADTGAEAASCLHEWAAAGEAELRAKGVSGPIVTAEYVPDESCFFSGEDPIRVALGVPGLIWLDVAPRTPWPAPGAFDPYTCNLRIRLATTAATADVEHHFRYVPDCITLGVLPGEVEQRACGSRALGSIAVELLEAQRRALAVPGRAGQVEDIAVLLRNICLSEGVSCELGDAGVNAARISAEIDRLLSPPADAASAGDGEPASVSVPDPAASIGARSDGQPTGERTLRVEQGKVDALMNLVGELVVAKNALPFLARDAELRFGSRELSREIKDKYSVIDRITRQMQNAVMDIRMMPVSDLFKRFPRLVRDIARKQDKLVRLVIEGETTEADKNIIEALAEPLTHVLRNSLDHGIESREGRLAAGKAEAAVVRLTACQDGDSVIIEVSDDGRGIDPERVRAKAVERGLIDAERAIQLSDAQAVQLVFLPGFSTAEAISDLSGRGVGMDAVRTVVERFGGTVSLDSKPGQGTSVRLKLPLSMAVTRVLTVELAGQLYGIPMDLVVETVRLDPAAIRRLKASEAVVLRDQVIPIVRLRRVLGMEDYSSALESVLILKVSHATVGLVIDDFGTGMDIILKPFAGILANMSGFSGTAVLGDGRVLLVLNLKEML